MSRDPSQFNYTPHASHPPQIFFFPPKSFLSRRVVSDSDSRRGYKLSSVPLSRLSQRKQQEAPCTPQRVLCQCVSRHSVPDTPNQPPSVCVSVCVSCWLDGHLSVCL